MANRSNVSRSLLMAAFACAAISAGNADAVLVFEFIQQGNDVGLNVSGSLSGLPQSSAYNNTIQAEVNSSAFYISSGPFAGLSYIGSGSTPSFGTGSAVSMTSYSGDMVFFGFNGIVGLDLSYAQGSSISGTGLFTGQTLAGLGLSSTTPGLLGTWTVGSDSIEVWVGPIPSPSPAAAPGPLPLLGAGAAFAASRRLRARLNAGSSSPLA